MERCAGYLDADTGQLLTNAFNTEYIFYTDSGFNSTRLPAPNITAAGADGDDAADDDEDDDAAASLSRATRSQVRDRGLHVLNMETLEQQCKHRLSDCLLVLIKTRSPFHRATLCL